MDPEERWGHDPKLEALLGAQGATALRAMLDGFPEPVGLLWAIRDDEGRLVDFSFGYGNPEIMRLFRLPASMRDRYTLLEALPQMRGSAALDAYVRAARRSWPRSPTTPSSATATSRGPSCTARPSSATA
jgi:hypothetical protein